MRDGPARIAAAGERWARRSWRTLPWLVWGGWAVALVIRLTVRDAWSVTAPLFYATPPVVLAALPVVAASLCWRRHAATLGLVGLLVGTVSGIVVAHRGHLDGPRTKAAAAGEVELVLWNAQRGRQGVDRVVAAIADSSASVVAVIETGDLDGAVWDRWTKGLPQHECRRLPGGMLVAVRGAVEEVEDLKPLPRSRAVRVVVRTDDAHRFQLVLVDVASNPLRSREDRLARIRTLVAPLRERPTLVVGDFNTPADSVWFDAWREAGWTHGIEQVGHGWYAGYKSWLPLLDLDHAWTSAAVELRSAELLRGWPSDHRPLRITFEAEDAR